MPETTPQARKPRAAPSRRAWLLIPAAIVVGLLLFLLIYKQQRDDHAFFRANAPAQDANGQQFTPLPGPDTSAATDRDRSQLPAAPADSGTAHIIERAPPAPAAPPAAVPRHTPAAPAADTSHGADSQPLALSTPAPRYPADAMRRGESGEALLRIHVDRDGVPFDIDLVRSSGSRSLDRAATEAVRRWRFTPARRGGVAVEGTVQAPIAFTRGQ